MEVTFPGGWVAGWVAGWPGSDNKTISVQLDLTWTGTGTELGKKTKKCVAKRKIYYCRLVRLGLWETFHNKLSGNIIHRRLV